MFFIDNFKSLPLQTAYPQKYILQRMYKDFIGTKTQISRKTTQKKLSKRFDFPAGIGYNNYRGWEDVTEEVISYSHKSAFFINKTKYLTNWAEIAS